MDTKNTIKLFSLRSISIAKVALPAALFTLLAAPAALALTWDTVSGDNPTITDDSGNWDLTAGNLVWNNNANPNVIWSQTSTTVGSQAAVFGSGTDGTVDQWTVTLGSQMAATSLTFNNTGYKITNSTIQVSTSGTVNGSITVAAGKTASINSTIGYVNNGTASITVNSGGTLNLRGGAGNAQYNFSGAGTVNMTAGTYNANSGTVGAATFNHSGGTFDITPGNNVVYSISSGSRNVNYTLSGTGLLTVNNGSGNTAASTPSLTMGGGTSGFLSTLTVNGGTLIVATNGTRQGEIRIGTSTSNGKLDAQAGAAIVGSGNATNKIYFFKGGASATYSATMTQSGGTVTANGIQFGGVTGTYDPGSSATLQLSGGSLYVGAQGIARGSAAGALPVTIQLQGGTLGADQNWSSALDMKLGTTGGGPTIRAQNSASTARNITLSGMLSDDTAVNGTLTKTGTGTLTLSGASANTFSGATLVSAGTLDLGKVSAVSSSSSVTIASGAALALSTSSSTVSSLTFANTGTLNFNVAAGYSLTVSGTDGVTNSGAAGSVTLNITGSAPANGTYTLISYSGSLKGSGFSAYKLGPTPAGNSYALIDTGSAVQLVVTDPITFTWTGAQSPEWSTAAIAGSKNWASGASPTDYADNNSVVFDGTATGYTVDLSVADVTPSAVTFTNNGATPYTLQGSKAIAGTTALTKQGSQTLNILNSNTYTGDTTISAGTLLINGSLAAGSTVTNYPGATIGGSGVISGELNLAAGSIVTNRVGSPLTVGTLNLAGNAVMNVSTPSVLGHGDYVLMNFGALQGGGQFTTLNVSGAGVLPGATNSVVITSNGLVNLHVAATNPPARPSPFVVVNSNYKIAGQTLANFNSAGADKLVVTICCEANGPTLTGVTFGGVPMIRAIYQLHAAGFEHAAIYYLDHPSGTGNIVASWSGGVGGAGIGAIALKGATDGVAFTAFDDNSRSLTLTNLLNEAFVVTASVGDVAPADAAAHANPPLTQVVGGWNTGNGSDGSAGYVALQKDGPFTASFTGSSVRPVTVAAVFGADLRKAYAFSPAAGAVAIATNVTLTWAEGIYGSPTNDNAVYFGTDYAAVLAADVTDTHGIFKGRQSTNRYSPGALQSGATYYWRIDQHNDAIPASPWKGPVLSFTVGQPKYVFSGSMSSNTTVAYLARGIKQSSFCQPNNLAEFNEDKRMLRNIGAKFIGRAVITWGVPSSLTNSLMADYEGSFRNIQGYADRMLAEDAEMILQGTLFEIVQSATNSSGVLVRAGVDQIPIPAWVFQAFGQPVVARNFNYDNMLYSFDPFGQYNNRWDDRSSVPDITKLETRMYFYYRACRFIDVGFESLHLGQIDIMDNNDGSSHSNTIDLLNKIRAYAGLHARRGFILLDADAPNGNIAVNGNLLFDIGTFPLRPREVCSTPTNSGVYDAILEKNYIDSLYGRTVGGTTPSGWYCARVPYNVSFDNSGALANAPVCDAGTAIWPWGWEESSWFAHNPNAYRNQWLGYAMNWLKTNDNVGYLLPAGRISISGAPMDINGDGLLDWEYRANTPSPAAPTGFGQEETIKSLWAEPVVLPPLQQWRLAYFGTTNTTGLYANDANWDGDGLKNIFEYAFNTNPTNANASPMTFRLVSDHLQVKFPRPHPAPSDITYLYEVSTNLVSGAWNTGPAWATESVTDNLNGTETVTLTVTPAVSTTSPVFFRLRISQP